MRFDGSRPVGTSLGLASGLLLAFAVVSCSSAPAGDKTTLRIWAMGREGEVLSQLITGFEKEHPNIHVEVQQIPWTAAHEKLLTAYVGDATPDIAMLGNTWVPEFVALNSLAPLDSFAEQSKEIRRDDFFTHCASAGHSREYSKAMLSPTMRYVYRVVSVASRVGLGGDT